MHVDWVHVSLNTQQQWEKRADKLAHFFSFVPSFII